MPRERLQINETSLPRLLLTFSYAVEFLAGHGPVLIHGLGTTDILYQISTDNTRENR